MSKYNYNIQGDYRQLEFSVELAFLGHSSSLSALSFENFLNEKANKTRLEGNAFEWNEQQKKTDTGLLDEFNKKLALSASSDENLVLERRTFRWHEAIPRPRCVRKAEEEWREEDSSWGGERAGKGREEEEEEEEEEGKERKEEQEQVPEDPTQSWPKSSQKRSFSHRIFTIVDSDLPFPVPEKRGDPDLLQQSQHSRQKRIAPTEQSSSMKELVRWKLSTEQKDQSFAFSEQRMRLMAYLGEHEQGQYNSSDEYLLWEFVLINGQMLRVQPDLGRRLIHSRRGTFAAEISANEPIQFDTLEEREEESQEEEEGDETVNFELSEAGEEYRLHFMLEIVRSRNFPNWNLRVEWLLELPSHIQLLQPEMASGQTQQCATNAAGKDIAQFGHLLQFSLEYQHWPEYYPTQASWPSILFCVTSEDSWGRSFVNGYSRLSLPANPGKHECILACWRQRDGGNSKLETLRNVHLGNPLALNNFERLAGPKAGSWSTVNMELTGSLELTTRCIHQSKHFISRELLSSFQYIKMIQRARLDGGLHWKIVKVLEEFENARRQLLALRAKKGIRRMLGQ